MLASDSPPGQLPDPIPASYYAQAPAPRARRLTLPAPSLAASAVIGGVLASAALVVLVPRILAAAPDPVASHRPPAPAATHTPAPAETPLAALPTDSPSPTPTPTPTPTATQQPTPTPSPTPSTGTITFVNAPLSVQRGRTATLQARTPPRTTCAIDIGYASAPNLDPASSGVTGSVSWSWRVSRSAPVGTWPIRVTCGAATATTQIVLS